MQALKVGGGGGFGAPLQMEERTASGISGLGV